MATYTLERNANGSLTAWWLTSAGDLRHTTFYGYTKREIRAIMRRDHRASEAVARGRSS